MEKYNQLVEKLKQYDKLCISFSGGADSSLLLKAAKDALGDKAIAVIADTSLFSRRELEEAEIIAEEIGMPYYVTEISVLEIPQLKNNESNRCYHCKHMVFSAIAKVAYHYGIKTIADGRIADDSTEYRPGIAAARELGVISPLDECGIYKSDVREISKKLGLSTWNKPTNSCLTTRFPYETEISKEKLNIVEYGEEILARLGFSALRLRVHGDMARIEVPIEEIKKLVDNPDIYEDIKDLGFRFVTVDLGGFRSGSMD